MSLNVDRIKRRIRSDVVDRLALRRKGRVQFCQPSYQEKVGAKPRKSHEGNDGKVIYPSEENAAEAARFLSMEGLAQVPYECPRGHWHLRGPSGRKSS